MGRRIPVAHEDTILPAPAIVHFTLPTFTKHQAIRGEWTHHNYEHGIIAPFRNSPHQ